MSQLELPGIITYGDGSWEIIDLDPKKIRGDIRKNYPLGNPMHGFTLGIENDFHARKKNLEPDLQSELNLIESAYPPDANRAPEAELSRRLSIVNDLLFKKNKAFQQQLKLVKTAKQYAKLEATYNAMILNDQIAILQSKQTNLYAEADRLQAKALAMQQAAKAARQAEAARKTGPRASTSGRVAGAGLAALLAIIGPPGFTASAIGVISLGIIIATIASLLEAENIEKINTLIYNPVAAPNNHL